jgi:hypothetical protein
VVQGTWYRLLKGTNEYGNKDSILYIWHTAGWTGTPLPEGWLVGAENIPCSDLYKQKQQQKAE